MNITIKKHGVKRKKKLYNNNMSKSKRNCVYNENKQLCDL